MQESRNIDVFLIRTEPVGSGVTREGGEGRTGPGDTHPNDATASWNLLTAVDVDQMRTN